MDTKPYALHENFIRMSLDDVLRSTALERRTGARMEAFYSERPFDYTYGRGAGVRTYRSLPFPEGYVYPHYRARVFGNLDLCFVNYYEDERQHLGWHSDDSPEQDDSAPIVVFSFGAEREIWVREKESDQRDRIVLPHGSAFVMKPGMQQTHEHRIPKCDRPCGSRLSMTWRKSAER